MKWLCTFVSVLLVLVVSALGAPTAKAGTTITQTTCPIIITVPGEYDLATDVGPCTQGTDGIDILASDVTLHLDGHTINGSAAAGTCNTSNGVRVSLPAPAPMLSHVRVLGDGTISNFFIGFRAENSNDSFVKFTTVTANCPFFSYGLAILGPGSHWKLQGNVVREPGPTSTGILLQRIDDNHLVANDVNDTIALLDSSKNVIANNIADDNAGGIALLTITTGSNNNEIHANTTNNNNTSNGLTIARGSTGNKVTGNYSFANLPFDMEDDNPACGTNRWRGNHFGKANQSCIRSGKDDDSEKDDDRKDDD
jgi:hypothetical protein